MAYRMIRDPKIDQNIIPWRTEQWKRKRDKKTGKFISVPSSTVSDIVPSSTVSDIVPSHTEQKETERDLKRLALKTSHTSSPKEKTKNQKPKGEQKGENCVA